MADVYKFKVSLKGMEKHIWRDIEITSVSSVAKLGYAVLASVEANANHLFYIEYDGVRYEFPTDDIMVEGTLTDPSKVKLASLYLKEGSQLKMEYDYGASWMFDIELISITELGRGVGNHYPYVTNGAGKGIVEELSLGDLLEVIERTDKTGELPLYYDYNLEKKMPWDYREFDLKYLNTFFKDNIASIADTYECLDCGD
ncbi:MAG: plasmid pRiA4b ORF-3 family protein [Oscillospiraceae bacterium]|nr:plasmid pRiA4b ORF-3 family protein [Oscillospiraceae bacterium]